MEISSHHKIGIFLFSLTFFLSTSVEAQKLKRKEKKVAKKIETHVSFLSDDQQQGRATGSSGEQRTVDYISSEFEKIGLTPKGDEGYLQYLYIPSLRMAQANTSLMIDKKVFTLFQDFYPISQSANNGIFEGAGIDVSFGVNDPGLKANTYEGKSVNNKTVFIKIETPTYGADLDKFAGWDFKTRAEYAKSLGAKAVIFYTDKKENYPSGTLDITLENIGIPVFFAKGKLNEMEGNHVSLATDILLLTSTGYNVAGYLDKGAKHTIVVGAHHDHLGLGSIGNALEENKNLIHNGANNNASGVAGMIELARIIKNNPKRFNNYNYLFVAFSGNEQGLLGSKHFIENCPVEINSINYMINLDMIGSLDSTKSLYINGTGSISNFEDFFFPVKYPSNRISTFTASEAILESSDQVAFNPYGVPSLNISTGASQYTNLPSDNAATVNVTGETFVIVYICDLMKRLDKLEKLEFNKTLPVD